MGSDSYNEFGKEQNYSQDPVFSFESTYIYARINASPLFDSTYPYFVLCDIIHEKGVSSRLTTLWEIDKKWMSDQNMKIYFIQSR